MNKTIMLSHNKVHLWISSGIFGNLLDQTGNPKPLITYIKQIERYALLREKATMHITKNEKIAAEEYRNTYGWMGEVLCEFWLKRFGHLYDIERIVDTSANEFQRGYDFTAQSIFEALPALIQVKMTVDGYHQFQQEKLHTFFDEVATARVLPQYTFLMCPTNVLSDDTVLSYKKDFRLDYTDQIHFIGQDKMRERIQGLPKRSETPFLNGNHEFFTLFADACASAVALQSALSSKGIK